MNRSRILSDAEFIKGGAEVGQSGKIRPTEEQISGIQDQLKTAQDLISRLEGHDFQEEIGRLSERGAVLKRDMLEFNAVTNRIDLNESYIARNAALSGEIRADGVNEYKEKEKRFNELRKTLDDFFREVQEFVDKYDISRLGGVDLTYKRDGNALELAKNIGAHFATSMELIDAIIQARNAKLYNAYMVKKDVTGTI